MFALFQLFSHHKFFKEKSREVKRNKNFSKSSQKVSHLGLEREPTIDVNHFTYFEPFKSGN